MEPLLQKILCEMHELRKEMANLSNKVEKLSSPNIEIPEMQKPQDDSSTTSLNISNQTPDMPEATEETTPDELADGN